MKKLILLVLVLTAFASAQVGIGYDGTLGTNGVSGVSGVSVQLPVGDNLYAQFIGSYSATEDDVDEFDHNLGGAIVGWYTLKTWGQVSVSAGAGAAFSDLTSEFDANNVSLELPVGVNYQFTDNFSISGQTGIAVQLGDDVSVDAFRTSNFLGAFAFHVWI